MHICSSKAAVCVLLLLLNANLVFAQNTAVQIAKGYFEDGRRLFDDGNYAAAAEKFIKANEYKPHPDFLYNIAFCYEKSDDWANACNYYQRFLKASPQSNKNTKLVKRITKICEFIAHPPKAACVPACRGGLQCIKGQCVSVCDPACSKGETCSDGKCIAGPKLKPLVIIESTPEGAAIYLEDKSKGIFGHTPYIGSFDPGDYVIILELSGYQTVEKSFTVIPGRSKELSFGLVPIKETGWIEIRANIEGAKVYIDDKKFGSFGTTPWSNDYKTGKHKIIVEKRGFEPFVKTIIIEAGRKHTIDATLIKVKHGWIKLTGRTTVGAKVFVDGKSIKCLDYPCSTTIPKGVHTVELEKDGYKSYSIKNVNIGQAEEVQLAIRLNLAPSRIPAYVAFGIAAGMLGGAIASGVISNAQASSLEEDKQNGHLYDNDDPRISKGKITAIVADSLFAASGVAAILGVYYLFRDVGPDSYGEVRRNKLAITPMLGPQTAGLVGQVRF